jgi:hypothetical protein
MFSTCKHQGEKMAMFSKNNNGKRQDEQAKVVLDKSLEEKAAEDSSATEPSASPAAAEEPTAQAHTTSSSAVVEPAAPERVATAPASVDTDQEDIEPENILAPSDQPIEHRFGIDEAIQLMRSLPSDPNTSLVVRVVRVTLGAVNVSVEDIVADALRKEAQIKESIADLESGIVDLEGQLGALRRQIAVHQADLKETANVRERLHQADQYSGLKPPPTPIAATLARPIQAKPISS